MWEKIKGFLAFLGACFVSFCVALLFRRSSDGQGSTGDSERDKRIKEGIADSTGAVGEAERITEEVESGLERCSEHLSRAEEILRTATERSKKK